jgi:hypothetical protein
MNTKSIPSVVLAWFMCLIGSVTLSAATPAPEDATLSAKLITAVEKSDYAAFIADGEAPFQQMKKEQFESVCTKLAPRFKGGYAASYLEALKQKGYRVTLWKLSFNDGGDDMLVTLAVKDGKVGGFFIK